MSDPQQLSLKEVAKEIFNKKAEENAPIHAEVREYFVALVKAVGDAGYECKKGHDYYGMDKEDKAYFDSSSFDEPPHDILRFDDRKRLSMNMIGRMIYHDEDSVSSHEDCGLHTYYGPYQGVKFNVTPQKTTITVNHTHGYIVGTSSLWERRHNVKPKSASFDWKDRDKAFECITAWVLENSSPKIVDKILSTAERKAAPAIENENKEMKVGTKMADGSVFAGLTGHGAQIFAMPTNLRDVTMTFNDTAKMVAKLNASNALGHDDWEIPTLRQMEILKQSQDKGALSGTFNMGGTGGWTDWYWSSTPRVLGGGDDMMDGLHISHQGGCSFGKNSAALCCRPVRIVD
ncbi:MAG TPA: hypothetical protein VN943_05805 [Candidatus Acidoferrum sp.]|nr:hypothetical protein [Candidatus Acidoferrum sp.]